MIAVRENPPKFTPEEYFAWEEQQLDRHEYIDGEVYAISGGTIIHSQIASNFGSLLNNHLRESGCKTLNSSARSSRSMKMWCFHRQKMLKTNLPKQLSRSFLT
jgi:Uma2 family endonuclease